MAGERLDQALAQRDGSPLWWPNENLQLPAPAQQLFTRDQATELVRGIVGGVTYSFSSWSSLAARLGKPKIQGEAVAGVQAILEHSLAERQLMWDAELGEVQILVVKGSDEPEPPAGDQAEGGWLSWLIPDMTSRASFTFNRDGHQTSSTFINVHEHGGQFDRHPPSWRQLGVADKLQALQKEHESRGGDTYVMELDHSHEVTYYDPPRGRVVWRGLLVLLLLRLRAKEVRVLQVALVEASGLDGLATITAHALSGHQVAAPRLHPATARVSELFDELARAVGARADTLRLVCPDGRLLVPGGEDASATLAAALLPECA